MMQNSAKKIFKVLNILKMYITTLCLKSTCKVTTLKYSQFSPHTTALLEAHTSSIVFK